MALPIVLVIVSFFFLPFPVLLSRYSNLLENEMNERHTTERIIASAKAADVQKLLLLN